MGSRLAANLAAYVPGGWQSPVEPREACKPLTWTNPLPTASGRVPQSHKICMTRRGSGVRLPHRPPRLACGTLRRPVLVFGRALTSPSRHPSLCRSCTPSPTTLESKGRSSRPATPRSAPPSGGSNARHPCVAGNRQQALPHRFCSRGRAFPSHSTRSAGNSCGRWATATQSDSSRSPSRGLFPA